MQKRQHLKKIRLFTRKGLFKFFFSEVFLIFLSTVPLIALCNLVKHLIKMTIFCLGLKTSLVRYQTMGDGRKRVKTLILQDLLPKEMHRQRRHEVKEEGSQLFNERNRSIWF
jgi:hypothetical protein